jgi:hypothetical protein
MHQQSSPRSESSKRKKNDDDSVETLSKGCFVVTHMC